VSTFHLCFFFIRAYCSSIYRPTNCLTCAYSYVYSCLCPFGFCASICAIIPRLSKFYLFVTYPYFHLFAIRLCLSFIWASFLSEHILFLLSTTWYLDRSAFHLWPVYQQCLYSICAYILSVPSFHLCVTVYIPSIPIFHIMPLYHIFVYYSFAYIPYNANIPSMCIFHLCLYSI